MIRYPATTPTGTQAHVVVGQITTAFGIRGWVKVRSYTEPAEQLFRYPSLTLITSQGERPLTLEQYTPHQSGYVAKFNHISNRDDALAARQTAIVIPKTALSTLEHNEYYWHDLIGLQVYNQNNVLLGQIDTLFETGANDVMVVRGDRERLIPYVMEHVVIDVCLTKRTMVVDWDTEF